jgi:hypothetical protein
MVHNAYQVYGLRIHTDLSCPELPRHPNPAGDPDVTITLLPQDASAVCPSPDGLTYKIDPGYFQLNVAGVARYSVEEGRRILIHPLSCASPEKIRLFLFGSTIGALLYQRGLLPLHGSAVVTQWGGMIFVGPQGSGKSTLAAEFHRRGYQVLSDDVCAVESTAQGLRILPALAQLRLRADTYEQLGASRDAYFDSDKFAVPIGETYCTHPVPLKVIHILNDDGAEQPRFQIARGLDRVRLLFENLYRPQYLKGQRTQAYLASLAAVIAQKAKLARLSRRKHTSNPADLVSFLESTWPKYLEISSDRGKEPDAHSCF